MKRFLEVEDIALPKKIYIVTSANLEYNDSTFHAWGEIISNQKWFPTKEDAKKNLLNLYIHEYGFLRFHDLDSYTYFTDKHDLLLAFLEFHSITDIEYCDQTISSYIEWVKLHFPTVSNEEILKSLPNFYSILEITKS